MRFSSFHRNYNYRCITLTKRVDLVSAQNQWNGPDPMAVMRIASAYWNSSVLHVAHSLDVFTALAAGPATAADLTKNAARTSAAWS